MDILRCLQGLSVGRVIDFGFLRDCFGVKVGQSRRPTDIPPMHATVVVALGLGLAQSCIVMMESDGSLSPIVDGILYTGDLPFHVRSRWADNMGRSLSDDVVLPRDVHMEERETRRERRSANGGFPCRSDGTAE